VGGVTGIARADVASREKSSACKSNMSDIGADKDKDGDGLLGLFNCCDGESSAIFYRMHWPEWTVTRIRMMET